MDTYAYESYVDSHFQVALKNGNEANVWCFNPNHDDGKPSCWINMDTGAFHCFSCQYSGTIASKQTEIDDHIMAQTLLKALDNLEFGSDEKKSVTQHDDVLTRYRFVNHPYWVRRRVNQKMQQLFELGYDAVADAATIPLRDPRGALIGVTRRFLEPEEGESKYKYPKGFTAAQNVFAAHLSDTYDMRTVAITEGSIDAIRIWQQGFPAVAIFGSSISAQQIDIMVKMGVQNVVYFGDGDAAGQDVKARCAGLWRRADDTFRYKPETDMRKFFWMEHITDHQGKKDAGEMTDAEILKALDSREPYVPDMKPSYKKVRISLKKELGRYTG